MKVILVNGSPHRDGCTATALSEIASELKKENIDTEIFWLGARPIAGCYGCGKCLQPEAGNRCFIDDTVNEFLEKAVNVY